MEKYLFLIVFGVVSFGVIAVVITIKKLQKSLKEEQVQLSQKEKTRAERSATLSKSIKKIQWSDRFSIDEGIIDDDHKALFGLINKFNENIPNYQMPIQMVPIMTSLTKYTQTHFQREEKLQRMSAFPFSEDHKKEHEALINKFNGLTQKALAANEDNVTDVAIEIGMFLEEWLTRHVIESDLTMKPFVDRIRKNAKDMSKLD